MSDDLFGAMSTPAVRMGHQARGHRVRNTVIGVLVIAIAIWLAWLFYFSQLLSVRQIQVDGTNLVSTDDVIAAAGINVGEPMMRINATAVRQSVITNLIEVQSLTVTRQFPGTLKISVTERTPVFQVAIGTQYGLVSADGTVFHTVDTMQSLLVGDVPVGDPILLGDVATVILALPADLSSHVQYVAASTTDSITIQLDGDRRVIWGSAEQCELKAQVLTALLSVPGNTYDVSAPSAPAVR